MDQGADRPRDRRRFARIAINAQVVMSSESVEQLCAGPLHDISLGGLFVKTTAARPIGSEIHVRIAIPTEGVTVQGKGIVVRAVSAEESRTSALPAGMGIMFTELDDESRRHLERLVGRALAARGGG